MDAKSYCESVGIELNSWKAKLYDVIRKADALAAASKQAVDPVVNELNTLIDELDQKIASLASECPSEWSADKTEIEGKLSRMGDKWKEVWGAMGEEGSEYGIGGA